MRLEQAIQSPGAGLHAGAQEFDAIELHTGDQQAFDLLARRRTDLGGKVMVTAITQLRSAGAAPSRARIAFLLALLFALGCYDSPSEPRGDVSFQNVAKASLSPRSGPQLREVVRDQARYEAVWRELWGDSRPARPAIDFRREMVIVATASLPCFGEVEIEDVDRERGTLVVRIADAGPPPLCLCFAPEYSFHVVRADRVEGQVSFLIRATPPVCD